MALGFAVIFKATDVFNFAQGMFVVCGAYFAVTAISLLGLPFRWLSPSLIGAAALLDALIHVLLIQPLSGRPMLSVIMLTIACCPSRCALDRDHLRRAGPRSHPDAHGRADAGQCAHVHHLHLTAALVSWATMAVFGLLPLHLGRPADARHRRRAQAAVVSGVNVNTMNRLAWAIGSTPSRRRRPVPGQLQIASTELETIGLLRCRRWSSAACRASPAPSSAACWSA